MSIDYHALLPEIVLSVTILVVLVVDLFLPNKWKHAAMPLAMVGVLATLAAELTLLGSTPRATFGGSFVVDDFAVLFQMFFLVVAVAVLAISMRYMKEGGFYQGEYYFLLLTSFLGCMLMPASRDLIMLFISLELVSAPGFLMAAFRKRDPKSNEAGLKFFLIGVLSTAVMLYGMSIIYGVTGGETGLSKIAEKLAVLPTQQTSLALAAIFFVVVGFAFKVSAFPFQFWAPDTYEGSPVPVAAFLAVASKAAGFAGLLQLMFVAFIHEAHFWTPLFAFIAIATMTVGNLLALQQRQAVRLLAFSGIAQAGYMLVPFALVGTDPTLNHDAFAACVTYILIYGVMNLGAFAVTTAVAQRKPTVLISDFAGLVRSAPVLAIAMTTCMISLAGIPPAGGFWGKLFIFRVSIERAGVMGITLAVVMLVNSVVSIFYYFAIPKEMLLEKGTDESPLRASKLITLVAAVAMIAVLAILVFASVLLDLANNATLVALPGR